MIFADAVRQMGDMSLLIGTSEDGKLICADLDETAHLLVTGVTGTGKSVFVESILLSLILRNRPEQLKFILCDSKMVELSRYSKESHMLLPTATDPKRILAAMYWAEYETMKRLTNFASTGVRSIDQYNELAEFTKRKALSRILIVIDDLTTILDDCPEIEEFIVEVLMKGRPVGIHLLLVTQSTSLKAVKKIVEIVPSRAVFLTTTERESRFLLRSKAACELEPFGSAIFSPTIGRSLKVKTIMATNAEADMILKLGERKFSGYSKDVMEVIEEKINSAHSEGSKSYEYYDMNQISKAIDVIIQTGQASVSMLQRELKLGYSAAARIIDYLEHIGVVGPFDGSKPRSILITKNSWKKRYKNGEKEQKLWF